MTINRSSRRRSCGPCKPPPSSPCLLLIIEKAVSGSGFAGYSQNAFACAWWTAHGASGDASNPSAAYWFFFQIWPASVSGCRSASAHRGGWSSRRSKPPSAARSRRRTCPERLLEQRNRAIDIRSGVGPRVAIAPMHMWLAMSTMQPLTSGYVRASVVFCAG